MERITKSKDETIALAKEFAKNIKIGDVIILLGDLGAGKTHFVKGLAQGLGSENLVTSPTFTIMNIYEGGKMPIYHFDMYRLSSMEEAQELGFEEYFDTESLDGVSVVEWPSQVEGLIKKPYYKITIDKIEENTRKISIGREE
jgi:tRNA threonylcarbamoyladenosine biosynthesis protein TsaE